MTPKLSFNVLLLSLLTANLASHAQPGPPPGVLPSPPTQAATGRPSPHANANHPAANIPGPIARLPRGTQELHHRGSAVFHHDGEFFARQGNGFRSIAPPIGVEMTRLPNRAKRVSRDIYRYKDVHFEKVGLNQYRVINAP